MLDLKTKALGFAVPGEFLGYAFTGLPDRAYSLAISVVWGQARVGMRYLGEIDSTYNWNGGRSWPNNVNFRYPISGAALVPLHKATHGDTRPCSKRHFPAGDTGIIETWANCPHARIVTIKPVYWACQLGNSNIEHSSFVVAFTR